MTQFNTKFTACPPQVKAPEKVYTRDEILLQREAYRKALRNSGYDDTFASIEAAREYPLPKKIVPKEITLSRGMQYRIVGGAVELRFGLSSWLPSQRTVEDFKKIGDLATNPTCEVDA